MSEDEMATEELAEMMSVAQVAERLGVHVQRVYQIVNEGKLPYVQTALGRLYRPEDVQRLEAARRG